MVRRKHFSTFVNSRTARRINYPCVCAISKDHDGGPTKAHAHGPVIGYLLLRLGIYSLPP